MNIYTHRTKFLTLPFFIIGAAIASAQEIQPQDLNAQGGDDDTILVTAAAYGKSTDNLLQGNTILSGEV